MIEQTSAIFLLTKNALKKLYFDCKLIRLVRDKRVLSPLCVLHLNKSLPVLFNAFHFKTYVFCHIEKEERVWWLLF